MGSVAPSRCSTGFSSTARGWSEGIQNSACLSGSFSGSQGKSQPPTLGKFVQALRRKVLDVGDILERAMIIIVASEIFPGEAGGGNMFSILIRRRRTPIDASKHGVTPLFRATRHPDSELSRYRPREVAGRFRYVERCRRSLLVISILNIAAVFSRAGRSPASRGRVLHTAAPPIRNAGSARIFPNVRNLNSGKPRNRVSGCAALLSMRPFPARSLPSPPVQGGCPDAPCCAHAPSCPARNRRCFPAGGLPRPARSR